MRIGTQIAFFTSVIGLRECLAGEDLLEFCISASELFVGAFICDCALVIEELKGCSDVPWFGVWSGKVIDFGCGEHERFGIGGFLR